MNEHPRTFAEDENLTMAQLAQAGSPKFHTPAVKASASAAVSPKKLKQSTGALTRSPLFPTAALSRNPVT